jgi:hypothetical protein
VLLGASNLTKGLATVVASAENAWGGPVEVLAALGHGRSYGRTTTVLGRTLAGIAPCGLWPALTVPTGSTTAATMALVTDIGNDLLYEEPVSTILAWVEQCLDRLAVHAAQTVVTLLPLDNLRSLSRARFTLMRSVLFPWSGLTLTDCNRRAVELDQGVRQLAIERGMSLAQQKTSWYGFDPVHIRRSRRAQAWHEIMSHWRGTTGNPPARGTFGRALYLRSRVPHHRHLLGIEQRRPQPAGRLPGGTTVAIY